MKKLKHPKSIPKGCMIDLNIFYTLISSKIMNVAVNFRTGPPLLHRIKQTYQTWKKYWKKRKIFFSLIFIPPPISPCIIISYMDKICAVVTMCGIFGLNSTWLFLWCVRKLNAFAIAIFTKFQLNIAYKATKMQDLQLQLKLLFTLQQSPMLEYNK